MLIVGNDKKTVNDSESLVSAVAVLKNVAFKVNLYKNSKMKVKTFFYSIVAFVGRLFSVVVLKKKKLSSK